MSVIVTQTELAPQGRLKAVAVEDFAYHCARFKGLVSDHFNPQHIWVIPRRYADKR
jgi:hypothetical protein